MNKSKQSINTVSVSAMKMILGIISIIPLSILYFISPVLNFFLENIAKYRKSTIKANLINCFVHFDKKEINKIVADYYKHLSEIIIENLKLFSGSTSSAMNFSVVNPQILDHYFEDNQDVILLTGHLGNWELGFSSSQEYFKHKVIGIYKSQSNEEFDKYLLGLRKKRGVTLVAERKFVPSVIEDSEYARMFMLIPDQNPKNNKNVEYFSFLNRRTPFNKSLEKIAKKYSVPVLYADTIKLKRGTYNTRLLLIYKGKDEDKDVNITAQYVRLLERNIVSNPSIWLWSHKRWKDA